jgi:hypothetical protein
MQRFVPDSRHVKVRSEEAERHWARRWIAIGQPDHRSMGRPVQARAACEYGGIVASRFLGLDAGFILAYSVLDHSVTGWSGVLRPGARWLGGDRATKRETRVGQP